VHVPPSPGNTPESTREPYRSIPMTDAISIQTLAQEARAHFTRKTRDSGESFWSYDHDTTPEWVQEMTRDAHGSMFPDDWRYQFVVEALGALIDSDDPDEAEMPEEIYNHNLCEWLASHGNRPGYVDDAMDEFGGDFAGIMQAIGRGYWMEQREVLSSVRASLEAKLEEMEEERQEDIDSVETGIDWDAVREQLDGTEWELDPSDHATQERRVFLGSCFTTLPSGSYGSDDPRDERWWELAEQEASERGLWVMTSEGDPCDILIGETRDIPEGYGD
jgi:hypothetical protein